jgi:uncharacterized protein
VRYQVRLILVILAVGSSSGCAALGPLSPLGPVEREYLFARNSASAARAQVEDSGTDVWITTADGVELHGRFYAHDNPRAVVLFCHGNGGSVASWSEVGRRLNGRHQMAVLVFDYRGYGKSAGQPTENGVYKDGRAALRWLADKTGLRESDIVLIGRSLGAAVAVDLAVHGGARGLILESSFSSLPDVVAAHAPWMAPHFMMTQRMNSASKITHYHGPLLQCHGDADRLVPIELARKLFDAAPGRKEFVVIKGANHNDPAGNEFEIALDRFVNSLPPVETLRVAGGRSRGSL